MAEYAIVLGVITPVILLLLVTLLDPLAARLTGLGEAILELVT